MSTGQLNSFTFLQTEGWPSIHVHGDVYSSWSEGFTSTRGRVKT